MIRGLLLFVMLAAAGAALAFFQSTTPRYAMLTGPIRTAGAQADTVSSDAFSVKVNKVLRANTITFKRYGRHVERQTNGVWLLVSTELWAKWETMPVRAAAIRGASGRLYRQSHRADGAPQLLSNKTLQPGLPTAGIIVFELPEEETAEMTLVLSRQPFPRLEDEISVSLDEANIPVRDRLEIDDDGI
jgi:hypothetical protein